jgi:hypothetical protein
MITTTIQPKQLYLARRSPALTLAEFRARWRRHGELAMGLPLWHNIFRYTQGDSIEVPAGTRSRLQGFDDSYDGIATVWFNDVAAVGAIPADPDHPILLRDEDEIFDRPVGETSIFTDEVVERDLGATMVKLVLLVRRHPGLAQAEFEAAWGAQTPALERAEAGWKLVRSYRRSVAIEMPGLDPSASSLGGYDGIAEIGFASLEDLTEAVADDAFVRALDDGFSVYGDPSRRVALVTTELLLYGA